MAIQLIFEKSKKIDPAGDKAKQINAHIADVCIKDFRPFSIVKDSGFCAPIQHAWPSYQIPKRETIRQLVMLRHAAGIKALKTELETLGCTVSITTDGWTSMAQDSYCTITGIVNY